MGNLMGVFDSFTGKRLRNAVVCAVVLTVAVCVPFVIVECIEAKPPTMTYRSLDYDAEVRPNGDLRITERIDVNLKKRKDNDGKINPWHQLYQRYKIADDSDGSNPLSAITDVSVKNVATGQVYKHCGTDSTGDLNNPDWDRTYAGSWYAADLTDSYDSKEGTEYLPANMSDDQYAAALSNQRSQSSESDGGSGSEGEDKPLKKGEKSDEASSVLGKTGDIVEIGWNIPATKSAHSMKFEISMTFKDVAKVYDDVAYLKWEPIGDSNMVPIGDFHARLTLPKGVKAGSSEQWMHYDGIGKVRQANDRTFDFDAKRVEIGKYVDLITMFDQGVMGKVKHRSQGNNRSSILEDERTQKNASYRGMVSTYFHTGYMLAVQFLAILLLGLVVLISNWENTVRRPIKESREIPNMTPPAAARLYDQVCYDKNHGDLLSREMSSTMLSLVSKGMIAVYPGMVGWYDGLDLMNVTQAQVMQRIESKIDASRSANQPLSGSKPNDHSCMTCTENGEGHVLSKKARVRASEENDPNLALKTITVVLLPAADSALVQTYGVLTASEYALLQMLAAVSQRLNSRAFDMRQVEDDFPDWRKGMTYVKQFNKAVNREFKQVRLSKALVLSNLAGLLAVFDGLVYLILVFVSDATLNGHLHGHWIAQLLFAAPVIFCMAFLLYLVPSRGLTPEGRVQAGKILCLRKYMQSFSDLSQREITDLRPYDWYLVYATAFGMSGEVTRRLYAFLPDPNSDVWLSSTFANSVLYWLRSSSSWGLADSSGPLASGFGDIGSQLSSGFNSISSAFAASSGSSVGGSFGGSGGGSGGGSFGGR